MNRNPLGSSPPPRGSRRSFLSSLGLAAVAGAGCSLRRETLPRRTFVLQAPEAESAGRAGTSGVAPAGVLLVRLFRVAPAYDARAFVIRRGDAEFTSDAYHGFLGSPGPMLTEAFAARIRGLGVFTLVTTGGSQVAPTHALEGEVTELYGDYRDSAKPMAVLGIELRLLHPLTGAAGSNLRWQRTERRSIPLARAAADDLVAGWNRALAEIGASLDPALFQRLPLPNQPQA